LFLRKAEISITIALLLSVGALMAQPSSDEQLAAQYYRQGEFDKALLYYERLYDRSPVDENYTYYLGCLLALEKFKEAEKLAERQEKIFPTVYQYRVDIGRVMLAGREKERAGKYFDRLIKGMEKASVSQFLEAGQAFVAIGEPDRALQVYYLGRKQIGLGYPFNFEIAKVLSQKGDTEGMINEYLDILEVNPGYIQQVQNTLNRYVGFEANTQNNAVLQQQLEKRVQKDPESAIYAQMLIWMFVQQEQFERAMLNAKALDKRAKGEGDQVIELADLAMSNFKYDVAIEGYEYVKEKGWGNYYYVEAMTGLMRALYEKTTRGISDQSAIQKLINEYQSAIAELGKREHTVPIVIDCAHIKAFYEAPFSETAISESLEMLENALSWPGIDDLSAAKLKMEQADIYMLNNRIWDASLLYGQVEKKFKYDEIGHAAKLKNALVFYYSGDFGWSEAQLNVLKGSTSKLISNDALELSAFISENTGLDTTTEALALFAHAQLFEAQHKFDSAMWLLNKVEEKFPYHELADNIIFERAKIEASLGNYAKAAELYMTIPPLNAQGILADNALIEAGRIFEEKLNNKELAMEAYSTLLSEYTGSLFIVEARKRFRTLRGDAVQ